MVREIRVKELDKDDELGIIKKDINFPGSSSILTPTKSFTCPLRSWKKYDAGKRINLIVNEIRRRLNEETILSLKSRGSSIINEIKRRFMPKKINLTFFHLRVNNIIDIENLSILSQFIYCSSEYSIILPTVDSSFLKENNILSEKRVMKYIDMIKFIIDSINSIGNSKPFIGMVPLIPPKYSRPLLELYQNEGIKDFVIDAGTADVLGSREFDYRTILDYINRNIIPLNEAFIYASNLGFGRFDKKWTIADDFLSIFAYVDIFGGTFKTRGFRKTRIPYPSRAKTFFREEYAYYRSSYREAGDYLGINNLIPSLLRDYNEDQQMLETQILSNLIGEIDMSSHLLTKNLLRTQPIKIRRLQRIADEINIK